MLFRSRLAPAAGRLALDLPDVVLPNVARLGGRVEEEREHVGRGLVAGDGRPFKEHKAALHVLGREDKRKADDEAGLRVAGAGQVVDDGEVALVVLSLHRLLPLQRHTPPHGALLGRLVHGLATKIQDDRILIQELLHKRKLKGQIKVVVASQIQFRTGY